MGEEKPTNQTTGKVVHDCVGPRPRRKRDYEGSAWLKGASAPAASGRDKWYEGKRLTFGAKSGKKKAEKGGAPITNVKRGCEPRIIFKDDAERWTREEKPDP